MIVDFNTVIYNRINYCLERYEHMRYPEFLKDNGRIGFVAPSFGCGSQEYYHTRFLSALDQFKAAGYTAVTGPNVYKEDGIGKSTSAKACGEELNDFFLNDRSDVIISVGGGETMCEDLNFTDFKKIASARPIWYMGYSDNTNLTFTLPTLCDTAAIYGPNGSSFGMEPRHQYLDDALSMLRGELLTVKNYDMWEKENPEAETNPLAPLNGTEPFKLSVFDKGEYKENCELSVNGRLLGGCLDILVCLCGTAFDNVKAFTEKYKKDGIVWFLESCDLNPLSIIRGLWQLKNAGWFDTAKAFLIGRPLHYQEEMMGTNCSQAVINTLKDLNVPIILDLDIGHLPPRMPIISGALGNITVKGNSFTLEHILK